MEHFLLALATLAFGLLLFTVGSRPAHSTDSSGEEAYSPPFPNSLHRTVAHRASPKKKTG